MKAAVAVPVLDLDNLPALITLEEIAYLHRLSPKTVRDHLQRGIFPIKPWDKYPYRFRREDVLADLNKRRADQPRRAHGFAARPKPARATLAKPAAPRSPKR